MMASHPPHNLRGFALCLGLFAIVALALLIAVPVRSAQSSALSSDGRVVPPPAALNNETALTATKPKEEPKKSHLEKTRNDAAELSALADQLRDELNKLNVNILPIDVIQKTEKVEKLARKIKGEAHEN